LTRLEEALSLAVADLGALGVRWALIGALAVAVRAAPRQTTDLDFVVLVADDREAESVVSALLTRGYAFFEQLEQRAGDRLAGMRLLTPGGEEGPVILDLLFSFSGIETEVVAGAEVLEVLPGLRIPVATTGHLLAMKVFAAQDRTKDLVDIPLLLEAATESDLVEARESVRLIERRGRSRAHDDLDAALAEHVRQHRANRGLLP
jgi:Nucleotidyl transferase AbiEii toxin, Type IV TA system